MIMDIPDRVANNTMASRFPLSTENAASRYSYFSSADKLSQHADRDLYYVDHHRHFTPFASDFVARSLARFVRGSILHSNNATEKQSGSTQ